MSEPLLEIKQLTLSFRVAGRRLPALKDFSLILHAEEVVGLVGESGSGKSSALFAIMNYLPENAVVESGSVRYRGTDLLAADRATLDRLRGRRLAMVYQDPGTALNPALVAGVQIAEVLRRHLGLNERQARQRTNDLLRLVELDDPEQVYHSYPHQLSGGMRQRVMIAMALSCEPEVLLMDEPTTALDVIVQAHVLDLVRSLHRKVGSAILFVTHNFGAVAEVADRIGVLYAGELMEIGTAEQVLRHSRNPYTIGLIRAVPRVTGRRRIEGIPGAAPQDPLRFKRCVFSARCAFAADICRTTRPNPVAASSEGHYSRCHFADRPDLLLQRTTGSVGDTPAAPDDATEPLLDVSGLSVEYRRGLHLFSALGGTVVQAVRNVSLRLPPERVLALVGESGSGKSTLARVVLRLESKAAGRILFEGKDVFALKARALRRFHRDAQIVFQNPTSSLNPKRTVGELVARPLALAGVALRERRDRVRAILASVGLGDGFLDRYPRQLSGGEKQRVALARAFVTEPKLVILDEPTTALDVSVQATILELLVTEKQRLHCAYLFISHDLAVVRQVADEVIVMRRGEVQEVGPVARVFTAPAHPYTRALIEAVPSLALEE
jgi:peptide/nickel transport system ATP-binding protein